VEFVLAGGNGAGQLDADTLRQLDGVRAARRGAGSDEIAWELRVGELHRTVPALLAELARRDLHLAQLRTHSATLEDVFVHLTGRQLREE
jgi:ABC-2 type transport system ATP-binding protein